MIGKYRAAAPLALLAGGLLSMAATEVSAQVAPSPNTGKLIAAAGGNYQWASTANYIGQLCPNLALGTDLRTRCAEALSAAATDPNRANMALDAITPEQVFGQGAAVDGAIKPATAAVSSRLSALSHIGFGHGVAMNNYRPVQIATAGDTAGLGGLNASRLQGYVTVVFGSGSRDDNSLETGYDADNKSVTVGMDYRFNDKVTAGVSLSYGSTNLDFSDNTGKMDADTWIGTVYGLWNPTDRLQLSGLFGYGRIDYSSDRHMNYAETTTSTIDRIAHGKTSGDQWELSVTAAYAMDAPAGWSYGPQLSLTATNLDLDAFSETGAQGLNFRYAKQSADSFQVALGFNVSKAISTSSGVISPYARVQAVYEAENDKRNVQVQYVDDTTGFFPGIRLTTLSPTRMRYMVGGGISGQFTHGWSGFVDAETVLGMKEISGYNVTLGVRKEF